MGDSGVGGCDDVCVDDGPRISFATVGGCIAASLEIYLPDPTSKL